VRRDARTIYRMFNGTFRAEVPFVRFDSSFEQWYGPGRITRARHKVVGIRGPVGSVSTWAVFRGERSHRYLYQSWLKNGGTWDLVWISRIIDESFQYGRDDTVELRRVAAVALRHALKPEVLARLSGRPRLPDTVIILRRGLPEESGLAIDGATVVWVSPDSVCDEACFPRIPFYVGFGIVRIFGDVAEAAIDFHPTPAGPLRRREVIKVLLSRDRGEWRFSAADRVW
jgi:hypothetical protein